VEWYYYVELMVAFQTPTTRLHVPSVLVHALLYSLNRYQNRFSATA
jgi:hypothetical protein